MFLFFLGTMSSLNLYFPFLGVGLTILPQASQPIYSQGIIPFGVSQQQQQLGQGQAMAAAAAAAAAAGSLVPVTLGFPGE